MRYGPPANPTEGQVWKSGRDQYRYQVGRGWVDATLYRPPEPPAPVALLCACGATMGRFAKRCRACFLAEKRAAAKPKVERHCSTCPALISPTSKSGKCRTCWSAEQAAKRPPAPPPGPPKFKPDPAEVERVRRAAERIDQAAQRREAARLEEERRALEEAAEVEVTVPASVPRPVDPLARKERARPHVPAKDPLDSDAFRAQLARVAAGARIVTVKPVSKREGVNTSTGSSLTNF